MPSLKAAIGQSKHCFPANDAGKRADKPPTYSQLGDGWSPIAPGTPGNRSLR